MQTRGNPRRGEIYLLDRRPLRASEQAGRRPGLVVSNDAGNRFSALVIVAALTSQTPRRVYPVHLRVPASALTGLDRDSTVMCEQLMTTSKDRLERRIGEVPPELMDEVDAALRRSLGLS